MKLQWIANFVHYEPDLDDKFEKKSIAQMAKERIQRKSTVENGMCKFNSKTNRIENNNW